MPTNEGWGKVMFLHVSVIPLTGVGVCLWGGGGVCIQRSVHLRGVCLQGVGGGWLCIQGVLPMGGGSTSKDHGLGVLHPGRFCLREVGQHPRSMVYIQGVCLQGAGQPLPPPPLEIEKESVRILLECFLVVK